MHVEGLGSVQSESRGITEESLIKKLFMKVWPEYRETNKA